MNHVVFHESRSLLLSNKDSYVGSELTKKSFLEQKQSSQKWNFKYLPGFLNYLSDFLGAREPIRNATGAHFSNFCSG
jgi:hypothetical protein